MKISREEFRKWLIENRDNEVEQEYSIENDGIGSYSYGSEECFDSGVDYIVGEVKILTSKIDFTKDDLENLTSEEEELILEIAQDNVSGEEADLESIEFSNGDIVIRYSSKYYNDYYDDCDEYDDDINCDVF